MDYIINKLQIIILCIMNLLQIRREYIFCPYILVSFPFWSLLFYFTASVPKIKNAFYFGLYCHLTNGNCLRDKWSALLAY